MLAALWSDLLAPRADWRWSAFRVARVIGDRGPSSTDRAAQVIGNWLEPRLPTVWDIKVILCSRVALVIQNWGSNYWHYWKMGFGTSS